MILIRKLKNFLKLIISPIYNIPIIERPLPENQFGKKIIGTKEIYLKLHSKAILNLNKIQSILENSRHQIKDDLNIKILKEKKIINKKYMSLKILGSGEIKKNISITANYASKQALVKVEKAGGKINLMKK